LLQATAKHFYGVAELVQRMTDTPEIKRRKSRSGGVQIKRRIPNVR
jgi:hypothetical protein